MWTDIQGGTCNDFCVLKTAIMIYYAAIPSYRQHLDNKKLIFIHICEDHCCRLAYDGRL